MQQGSAQGDRWKRERVGDYLGVLPVVLAISFALSIRSYREDWTRGRCSTFCGYGEVWSYFLSAVSYVEYIVSNKRFCASHVLLWFLAFCAVALVGQDAVAS